MGNFCKGEFKRLIASGGIRAADFFKYCVTTASPTAPFHREVRHAQ